MSPLHIRVNSKKSVSRLATGDPRVLNEVSGFLYSSFDQPHKTQVFANNKVYGLSDRAQKKHRRVSAKYGSATLRKNLHIALNSASYNVKNNDLKTKQNARAVISTSLYFNQNPPKKFKKELITIPSKMPNHDCRNSLNRFIDLNPKGPVKPIIETESTRILSRETSTNKISKIEYQVKRHCLKKKEYMKHPGKAVNPNFSTQNAYQNSY